MGRGFDIAAYAGTLAAVSQTAEEPRTIETVTGEILELKKTAGESILGIGQRLMEAKALLPHGEWLPWLTERVEFSERTAQNFMRLARDWSNPQALADLGATKALTLLALPPEERERFLMENHLVDGEEKTVINMSARELEQAVRERDEARQAMEQARAEADAAEESRAKMESDMAALKALNEGASAEVERRDQELARLRKALEELKAKPVEVAVETHDAAPEQLAAARAEAVAAVLAKLDRAKEAKAKAEEKQKAAEEALESVKKELESARMAEKKAALAGDRELAAFELLFSQAQEQINKLHGMLLKVRGRGDGELADKLSRALLALSESVRGCAE